MPLWVPLIENSKDINGGDAGNHVESNSFAARDRDLCHLPCVADPLNLLGANSGANLGHNNNSTSNHQSRSGFEHYESFPPHSNNNNSAAFFGFEAASDLNCYTSHDTSKMSLAYENRGFADYPSSTLMDEPSHDHSMNHNPRYPSPPPPLSEIPYTSAQIDSALDMQMPELPPKEEDDAGSPGRSKALVKPDREVTKGEDGRYICSWNGCGEEIRSFNRKCEWSKHMDKHDRPYKCPADGCEKLPGFTYSGGLLRHQREVHNLHGGPRKQLNCPHINCKRHSGKGFSRQENLNEHLRRVHTSVDGEVVNPEETEEEASERTGMKRKRTSQSDGRDNQVEMRDNYARLTQENADLRRQVELQGGQIADLVHQLQEFQQNMMNPRMPAQAPQAMM